MDFDETELIFIWVYAVSGWWNATYARKLRQCSMFDLEMSKKILYMKVAALLKDFGCSNRL